MKTILDTVDYKLCGTARIKINPKSGELYLTRPVVLALGLKKGDRINFAIGEGHEQQGEFYLIKDNDSPFVVTNRYANKENEQANTVYSKDLCKALLSYTKAPSFETVYYRVIIKAPVKINGTDIDGYPIITRKNEAKK